MRRQKGRSQAVPHINNSLGRSQIGLKAKDGGRGAVISHFWGQPQFSALHLKQLALQHLLRSRAQ